MSNPTRDTLDYANLLKEAKRLQPRADWNRLRVALLGDCAVQLLSPLLRALFARASIQVELYEGPFEGVDADAYDDASGLYSFNPDIIAIFDATQALRSELFSLGPDRTGFADRRLQRTIERWNAIRSRCDAYILQANLAVPLERTFGNQEERFSGSLLETVRTLNRELSVRASEYKNVLINDIDFISSYVGRSSWFDEKLWILAKSVCALDHLPLVSKNVVDIALATRGRAVKCIVLDLDNTLWGGVIGDDGLEGIRVGHLGDGEAFTAMQQFVRELSRRGVVLCVCSKNDYENAILPFREHSEMVLREKDIALFVANWEDKAQNIIRIKESLNIGYDSIVFLDDNPFERNLVKGLLPDVIVPDLPEDPANYVRFLSGLNLFETLSLSETDVARTELYQKAAEREEHRRTFENVQDYLRSLEMEGDIRRFDALDLPRIAQLIQRSNQFNLCTRRYSEAQCAEFIGDEAAFPISVRLRDRFGDHGLISVVVVRFVEEVGTIEEYLMSCRVLQRGVEDLVMTRLVEEAKARGAIRLLGNYCPTRKNGLVKGFYQRFGFKEVGSEADGATHWELDVDAYRPRETFIRPVGGQASDATRRTRAVSL
jgi:FkbH-like protein